MLNEGYFAVRMLSNMITVGGIEELKVPKVNGSVEVENALYRRHQSSKGERAQEEEEEGKGNQGKGRKVPGGVT